MNTQSTSPETFLLSPWAFSQLNARVAKINKRALKMHVSPIEVVEVATELRTDPAYKEAIEEGVITAEEAPKVTYHRVEVRGAAPKLAGWTFIGTLDHYSIQGKVIVQTVPGESIPKQFYDSEPVCDHCNKKRLRIETFIVCNESSEHKQIGRQCLKDFLGHDVKRLASYLEMLHSLQADLSDEDSELYYGHGTRQVYQHELVPVLTLAAGAIRRFGWVARSAAWAEGKIATASIVLDIISPSCTRSGYEASRKLREQIGSDPTDQPLAEAAIEWVKNQQDSNEYLHNLKAIVESGHTSSNTIGYTCSIIAAYKRDVERDLAKKRSQKLDEYVGVVGEKLEVNVEVIGSTSLPGYMDNSVTLYRMLSDQGHSIVWFSSGNSSLEQGKKFRIKGTVKKHELYNNWKQTTLTRVKVLTELTEEKVAA